MKKSTKKVIEILAVIGTLLVIIAGAWLIINYPEGLIQRPK